MSDGLRQSKLFPTDPADKMAAPDLSPRFHLAVNPTEFKPGNLKHLPLQHPSEDDSIAPQQNPGKSFNRLVILTGIVGFTFFCDGEFAQKRPTSGKFDAGYDPMPPGTSDITKTGA